MTAKELVDTLFEQFNRDVQAKRRRPSCDASVANPADPTGQNDYRCGSTIWNDDPFCETHMEKL